MAHQVIQRIRLLETGHRTGQKLCLYPRHRFFIVDQFYSHRCHCRPQRLSKKLDQRSGHLFGIHYRYFFVHRHYYGHVCLDVQIPARCQDQMAGRLVRRLYHRGAICYREVFTGALLWRSPTRLYLWSRWHHSFGVVVGFLFLPYSLFWGTVYLYLRQKVPYLF